MIISSRTPEGTPNSCPTCGKSICIEPSTPFGDAPCPICGSLVWFVVLDSCVHLINPKHTAVIDALATRFGITPEAVQKGGLAQLGLDSLDIVEVVMDLEEQVS